jgi:RHS repeat-associated protein
MGGTPVGQPFGFTGREHEVESGLVYARARYFSSTSGTWVGEDPVNLREAILQVDAEYGQSPSPADVIGLLVERPATQNRYVWPFANPARYTDPTGESADALNLGIGALSGVFMVSVAKRVDSISATVLNALLQVGRLLVAGMTSQVALYIQLLAVIGVESIIYATQGFTPPFEMPPTKSYQSQPGRPEPQYPKPPGTGCKAAFDLLIARCLNRTNYCGRIFCALGASLFYALCMLKKGG